MSNRLVDLKRMVIVAINNELIFLETRVTEVIVISVIIADLITVNPITSVVVRGVHFICSPVVVGWVCMAMEFRSMGYTSEDCREILCLNIPEIIRDCFKRSIRIISVLVKIRILITSILSYLSVS